jgi:hypothetical protein
VLTDVSQRDDASIGDNFVRLIKWPAVLLFHAFFERVIVELIRTVEVETLLASLDLVKLTFFTLAEKAVLGTVQLGALLGVNNPLSQLWILWWILLFLASTGVILPSLRTRGDPKDLVQPNRERTHNILSIFSALYSDGLVKLARFLQSVTNTRATFLCQSWVTRWRERLGERRSFDGCSLRITSFLTRGSFQKDARTVEAWNGGQVGLMRDFFFQPTHAVWSLGQQERPGVDVADASTKKSSARCLARVHVSRRT